MISVSLHNQSDISFNQKSINHLSNLVLNEYGNEIGEINIIILDDDTLRKMKKRYFKEDVFTDVISFNLDDNPFEGEIYISFDRVIENAQSFSHDFEDEFKRVLIHGLLHLCGFEDSTSDLKIEMTRLEDRFIKYSKHLVISS